jgi:predicted negative regulator of RcsB-dependent stress response
MRNHWRRNSLIAIVFASATIAGGQAQEQSGKNTSALGTDYQQGKAYLDAGKYEDALRAFKKANKQQNEACVSCLLETSFMAGLGDTKGALNSADKALTSSQTNELRAESHAICGDVLLSQNEEKKRSEAEAE